jgi:hypothetical protein
MCVCARESVRALNGCLRARLCVTCVRARRCCSSPLDRRLLVPRATRGYALNLFAARVYLRLCRPWLAGGVLLAVAGAGVAVVRRR